MHEISGGMLQILGTRLGTVTLHRSIPHDIHDNARFKVETNDQIVTPIDKIMLRIQKIKYE